MDILDVEKIIEGEVVTGYQFKDREVECAFASDLMSDVLTLNILRPMVLLTGLSNLQTIRTCEMADIKFIVFVRSKKVTEEMKELAEENGITLITTSYSLYRTSGLLFAAGLQPVY